MRALGCITATVLHAPVRFVRPGTFAREDLARELPIVEAEMRARGASESEVRAELALRISRAKRAAEDAGMSRLILPPSRERLALPVPTRCRDEGLELGYGECAECMRWRAEQRTREGHGRVRGIA